MRRHSASPPLSSVASTGTTPSSTTSTNQRGLGGTGSAHGVRPMSSRPPTVSTSTLLSTPSWSSDDPIIAALAAGGLPATPSPRLSWSDKSTRLGVAVAHPSHPPVGSRQDPAVDDALEASTPKGISAVARHTQQQHSPNPRAPASAVKTTTMHRPQQHRVAAPDLPGTAADGPPLTTALAGAGLAGGGFGQGPPLRSGLRLDTNLPQSPLGSHERLWSSSPSSHGRPSFNTEPGSGHDGTHRVPSVADTSRPQLHSAQQHRAKSVRKSLRLRLAPWPPSLAPAPAIPASFPASAYLHPSGLPAPAPAPAPVVAATGPRQLTAHVEHFDIPHTSLSLSGAITAEPSPVSTLLAWSSGTPTPIGPSSVSSPRSVSLFSVAGVAGVVSQTPHRPLHRQTRPAAVATAKATLPRTTERKQWQDSPAPFKPRPATTQVHAETQAIHAAVQATLAETDRQTVRFGQSIQGHPVHEDDAEGTNPAPVELLPHGHGDGTQDHGRPSPWALYLGLADDDATVSHHALDVMSHGQHPQAGHGGHQEEEQRQVKDTHPHGKRQREESHLRVVPRRHLFSDTESDEEIVFIHRGHGTTAATANRRLFTGERPAASGGMVEDLAGKATRSDSQRHGGDAAI